MNSGKATLISKTYSYDEIGQAIETETETEIFVSERSITRQEWVEAGRVGLNPSIELVTPFMNYGDQEEVEYNGTRYSIYRTYKNGDNIELYLEKKGGI